MDTLIVLKDTITVHVTKVVDACLPCVQEAEINTNGIWITLIICLTVVLITGIMAIYIYHWNKLKKQYYEDVEKCKEDIKVIAGLEQRVEKLEEKFAIPSDEKNAENFIEFCQNCKSFEEKMAEKCITIYEKLMKNRLKV